MYTKESYQQNRTQLKSRLLACGIPAFLLFVLMLVSFIVR